MTKQKKQLATRILEVGTFHSTSGNEIWKHDFYTMPMGNLVSISYKNGKMANVTNYGR